MYGVRDELTEPLLSWTQFNTNGYAYIARYVDETNQYMLSNYLLAWFSA